MSKTYLLAGASSETAKALSELLLRDGHKVIAMSTKEMEDDFYSHKYKVSSYQLNNLPAIEEELDGLVYFPGTINLKPFARFSESDFLSDFQINALGAATVAQKYLPNLKKKPGSSIVFISTVATQVGMPFHTSIAMAKGALDGLVVSLSAELAPAIRVNAIAPSLTKTPLAEKFVNTPEKMEASEKRNPMKHIGTPNDLANTIDFLLSEKSSWITGQIISVDGGMRNLKLM